MLNNYCICSALMTNAGTVKFEQFRSKIHVMFEKKKMKCNLMTPNLKENIIDKGAVLAWVIVTRE